MKKEDLFKIQQKYIDLLKWLEDNNFRPNNEFKNNSTYYQKEHDNGNLEIYPNIKISRGYDYIEIGSPSKEDIENYQLECTFNFNIKGDEDVMKKWHFFLGKFNQNYDKKHKLDSVFDNCYFDTFYNNNKIQINFKDYYSWACFGADYEGKQDFYKDKSKLKNLEFYIPIKINYLINTVKIN